MQQRFPKARILVRLNGGFAEPELSEASGKTEHVYTDFSYTAGTWSRERRVVCKAEVVHLEGREPRVIARFVVTHLRGKARRIHEHTYCMRDDAENRIKELFDAAFNRTNCSRFLANQLCVPLAAAAYVLLQELRLVAHGTAWARAQVATRGCYAARAPRPARTTNSRRRAGPSRRHRRFRDR